MSVYRRKSGRYAVLVDLEPTAAGQRRRKSIGTFRTRKDAEAAERKALEARDRGIDLSPKTVTVTELLDRFVADRRSKGRALRTVLRYEEIARLTIAPHIGQIAVAKLSPAHVSQWLTTLRERGATRKDKNGEVNHRPLAPKSVKHAHALLRSALRWAVRHELVWRNVADAIDTPTVPRSQARALNEDEAARFLSVADETRWGPFFRFALATGMRRGELLALRWEDLSLSDVGQSFVTVRRAFVETKGSGTRIVEKTTKTDRVRTIALASLGVDALRRQKVMQAQDRLAAGPTYVDSGYIFQNEVGMALSPFLATDAFRSVRTRTGIKATLHDLRHTAATWMLTGGVDVATVARVLGHTTPSTTLSIYAHALPAAESKAMAAIDERLARVRPA